MNSEINKDTTIFRQQKEMELLVRENNKLLTRYRTVQRANLRLKKKLIDKEISSDEISDEWIDIN
jgi:hypothetical protein